MSSNEIDRWLQRWPGVASRVNVNVPAAQGLAKSARVNIERAQKALAAKDFDAAVIWAELALVQRNVAAYEGGGRVSRNAAEAIVRVAVAAIGEGGEGFFLRRTRAATTARAPRQSFVRLRAARA